LPAAAARGSPARRLFALRLRALSTAPSPPTKGAARMPHLRGSSSFTALPFPRKFAQLRAMKLGFIGCGKMAAALIKGVLKSGVGSPADVTASDVHAPSAEKLAKETGIAAVATNAEVVSASDTIVLA